MAGSVAAAFGIEEMTRCKLTFAMPTCWAKRRHVVARGGQSDRTACGQTENAGKVTGRVGEVQGDGVARLKVGRWSRRGR